MTGIYTLRQNSWISDDLRKLIFPANWDISEFAHHPLKPLSDREIAEKINQPYGSATLDQIVRPEQNILLICDDITRPTRTDRLLPVLINLLSSFGLKKERISILIASGSHAPMPDSELKLKLGKDILNNHTVYQHHHKKNLVFIGKTTMGTPLYVNRLLHQYDLLIGAGGIFPHNLAGFSGGAKLILGVSGIRTILTFHRLRNGAGAGGSLENEFRRDVTEAAKMAGLNFVINVILNRDRDIIELVSGDTEKAFLKGVDFVRKHFSVPHPDSEKYDLIIADVYPFDASYAFARKGLWPIRSTRRNCTKLIIGSMHLGIGNHLVFPVPKTQGRFRRMAIEFKQFGLIYFLKFSLFPRIRNLSARISTSSINKDITQTSHTNFKSSSGHADKRFPSLILRSAALLPPEQFNQLPYLIFDDPERCFSHINTLYKNKPIKVALYRNSSLTFPENRS